MNNPQSPHHRLSFKEQLRRFDRVAADLNVVLVVIAIGLATLDATFLLAEKVIDNMPPITHIDYDEAPPASK